MAKSIPPQLRGDFSLLIMTIDKFYLQKAEYLLGDESGSEVVMKINYAAGKFRLVGKQSELKKRVALIAQDLIDRKHGVNFSDKLRQ